MLFSLNGLKIRIQTRNVKGIAQQYGKKLICHNNRQQLNTIVQYDFRRSHRISFGDNNDIGQ